jgi:RNA polymerase sigma-70 factor (ECF subfamily)
LQNPDDVAAWDEFVRLYRPVLYRVARGRGFQAADADNLVQEVMFAVARSVSQWLERADRGSFRAWLLRITRNEAVDTISRRATRPLGRDGAAAARVLGELPARNDISSRLDLEYERTVFQWAADRVRTTVAPHTWQAFWLTHVDGLPIEEVAKQLQTRPGNIYIGRSRVMARIKELVQKYEDNP